MEKPKRWEPISAQEWELLSFFESAPTSWEEDRAWADNLQHVYEIERNGMSLSCALAPAYRDVRLILKRTGVKLYELNATNVEDVRYEKRGSVELLEIVLSDADTILLRVKPDIQIEHFSNNEPEDD